ncbi:MAG: ClbS/DfsB family four-helix bundle protein [Chloroflexota bacterium]|nr:ClbS/DfsB family four-helix bundle protein [Chloroflexota bacterium]
MTKDELIASIKRDRATLDALVAPLDEAQMTAPALDGGWSVKDVLAHISAWEELCLKWIRTGRREEGPFTQETIDAFNQSVYDVNRDRLLDAILEESRQSYESMVEAVAALTDDLDATTAWAPGGPLGQIISANADEHYREHADQIRRWLVPHG